MNTKLLTTIGLTSLLSATTLHADNYLIDTKGSHASINFRISHLGTSWLTGRFNQFSGQFNYDPTSPETSAIKVDIDVTSIDSNHAERDKHLRGEKYLNVKDAPTASFASTKFTPNEQGGGIMQGTLELNGVSKIIDIQVTKVGEGPDPWGGYRAGFSGTTELKLKDFDLNFKLGKASETVYLDLNIEGIKQ